MERQEIEKTVFDTFANILDLNDTEWSELSGETNFSGRHAMDKDVFSEWLLTLESECDYSLDEEDFANVKDLDGVIRLIEEKLGEE